MLLKGISGVAGEPGEKSDLFTLQRQILRTEDSKHDRLKNASLSAYSTNTKSFKWLFDENIKLLSPERPFL